MKKVVTFIILTIILIQFSLPSVSALENHQLLEFIPQYVLIEAYTGEHTVVANQDYRLIDKYNNVKLSMSQPIVLHNEILYSCNINGEAILYGIDGKEVARFNQENILDANDYLVLTMNGKQEYFAYNYRTAQRCTLEKNDGAWLLGEESILLLKDDKWVIFNLTSQKYVSLEIDNVVDIQEQVLTVVSNGMYGLLNINAEVLVKPQYKGIVYTNNQYLAFNETGNDIFSSKGDLIFSSPDCMTSECINGWVVIYGNTTTLKNIYTNETRSIEGYKSVSAPYEGYMCGQNEFGLYTYVTIDGKQATDLSWDMVYRFSNGFALVYDVLSDSNNEYYKQWYIINSDFEVVKILNYDVYIDSYLDSSTDFTNGYIRTVDKETGLMGLVCLENYNANSNNRLKLSPTSLFQIDETSKTLSGVFNNTTSKTLKNHFLNDSELLVVQDANGVVLSADDIVTDGCKVQLVSATDGVTVLDELTIEVSEDLVEPDPPVTDPDDPSTTPNNPDKDSDLQDFIDSTADKFGITSDQLLLIAGGSLAALVLLIVIIVAVKRKRR